MTTKIIKYTLALILVILAIRFAIYTEPLSERKAREAMKEYNPEQLVDYHWQNSLQALAADALPFEQFVQQLAADPEALKAQSGHLLGIGSNVFYVITGEAQQVAFCDNEFKFESQGVDCRIPAKYIFGNVARDASGWFDIGEFRNTMDFNSVSACINKHIREQVIAPLLPQAQTLTSCHYCAAVEVRPGQSQLESLTLYPFVLEAL